MPRRNLIFTTNEVYHIYNRSVGKEEIFKSKRALSRVIDLVDYYRFLQKTRYSVFSTMSQMLKNNYLLNLKKQTPLIEVFSFAFMPNHYHFLVRQREDKGIYKFASNVQNSFAKYFNVKNNRHGALFQNPFKAKEGYLTFLFDQADYQRKLQEIKHLIIE